MTTKTKRKPADPVCYFCGTRLNNSPAVSPIEGIAGAWYRVCGPECSEADGRVILPRRL